MTKLQKDMTEALGFACVAFGIIWMLGFPWVLVSLGLFLVVVGNFGGPGEASST